jgi:hypothetical protein
VINKPIWRKKEIRERREKKTKQMATITVPRVVPSPAEDAAALLKAFQGYCFS